MTSLIKHCRFVAEFQDDIHEIDVQALQETALTTSGFDVANATLHPAWWQTTCGQAQPLRCGNAQGILDGKPGGVGILTRRQHLAVPTPRTQLGDELFKTGRWISTTVKLLGCAQIFHIVSIYGFTRANWDAEVAEATSIGDAPVIILGDFNVEKDNSRVLTSAHNDGRWVDAVCLLSEVRGDDLESTFSRNGSSSRIDMAYLNPSALRSFSDFRVKITPQLLSMSKRCQNTRMLGLHEKSTAYPKGPRCQKKTVITSSMEYNLH